MNVFGTALILLMISVKFSSGSCSDTLAVSNFSLKVVSMADGRQQG
jgi:hypothetical protein